MNDHSNTDIYAMSLHDVVAGRVRLGGNNDLKLAILRVPGGWIYYTGELDVDDNATGTFVPYTEPITHDPIQDEYNAILGKIKTADAKGERTIEVYDMEIDVWDKLEADGFQLSSKYDRIVIKWSNLTLK